MHYAGLYVGLYVQDSLEQCNARWRTMPIKIKAYISPGDDQLSEHYLKQTLNLEFYDP